MITFTGRFDIKEWARWAESFGIDGRAINFALMYDEEIFKSKNNVTVANARNYTTFCRAISGIKDWSAPESLSSILQISSGCFLTKDNPLGILFTQFINNKLDKLIEPKRMVSGSWEEVSEEMEKCIYDGENYRSDIASVLGFRFLNFCDANLGSKELPAKKVETRLEELFTNDKKLFTEDILHVIVKTLCKNHVTLTNKWFKNNNIRQISL